MKSYQNETELSKLKGQMKENDINTTSFKDTHASFRKKTSKMIDQHSLSYHEYLSLKEPKE